MRRLATSALVLVLAAAGLPATAFAQGDQPDGVQDLWERYPLDPEAQAPAGQGDAPAQASPASGAPQATPASTAGDGDGDAGMGTLGLLALVALAVAAGGAAARLTQRAAGRRPPAGERSEAPLGPERAPATAGKQPDPERAGAGRGKPAPERREPRRFRSAGPAEAGDTAARPAERRRRFAPSRTAEQQPVPVGAPAARSPAECSIVLERSGALRQFAAVMPDGRVLGRSAPFEGGGADAARTSPEARAAVRALESALKSRGWEPVPGTSRMRRVES